MIIMPANASGWFWHTLAHGTGNLGHLYSPGAQRGPWEWFPYALDNGAFSCWEPKTNVFDLAKWEALEPKWRQLLFWATAAPTKPLWAIVPDVPGDRSATLERWTRFASEVKACGFPLAIAVQDGMEPRDVEQLRPLADVVCVGGSTEWKWKTVALWAEAFPRVHLLRCNAPEKLNMLSALGIESTDGTGWSRGDRKQTAGLEAFCRINPRPSNAPLWPHVCRARKKGQEFFA